MNKDELIEELEELRDIKDYSQSELLNTGYRTAILDAIDLVKKSTIPCVSHIEKPPLGLKPKWIHDQQRQDEIMAAINRYLEAGKTPPKEWAAEFALYCC